jgi:enoyl-CoA hydratase
MADATGAVSIDHHDRVAVITLRRPGRRNTIDARVAFELSDACLEVRRDESVWAVVLTGAGEAFCVGTDPEALGTAGVDSDVLPTLRAAESVGHIEKPVVGALNGDALDQGLELALACDLRVASTGGQYGLTQLERGSIPWDGGTQRLPRLIGQGRAMEMLLTSRRVSGDEAWSMGLVTLSVAPEEVLRRAEDLASAIAGHGPIATRYIKEAVDKGLDLTLEQGLRLEADLSFLLQSTADRAEGIASFLERRSPEYGAR